MSEDWFKKAEALLEDCPEIKDALDQWDADNRRRFMLLTALVSSLGVPSCSADDLVKDADRLLIAVKEREQMAMREVEKFFEETVKQQTKPKNE